MYPEFKWKPRKLNNEKLKNPGIFSWQLLVERCNPLLVIWHGKWKETTVHTGFTTFKTTWTTTKGYLPGNIQKSSSYLSAGQGIPPYRERSAGEFEVVELYERLLLILIILASFDPKCQQAWRYLYFYVIGDFQCHHSNTLIRLSFN